MTTLPVSVVVVAVGAAVAVALAVGLGVAVSVGVAVAVSGEALLSIPTGVTADPGVAVKDSAGDETAVTSAVGAGGAACGNGAAAALVSATRAMMT